MTHIPYLPLEDRVRFLADHGFISDSTEISEGEKEWLESVNFHHLLGYARNYRRMIDENHWSGQKKLSVIRELINDEARFIGFLTPWLRMAEWHLRALAVKHFCSAQAHGGGYLATDRWTSFRTGDIDLLKLKILDSISRHSEPYVTNHLKIISIKQGQMIPEKCSWDSVHIWEKLVADLPLWSVIDSFSVGTLGKFLMMCGNQSADNKDMNMSEPVWKLVARDLSLSAEHFHSSVDGFAVLRNTVFHHQRLWMRPMSKSPGISSDLNRRYRDLCLKTKNKQAQLVALAMVSRFLPKSHRRTYLDALDNQLEVRALLGFGLKHSPFAEFTPK